MGNTYHPNNPLQPQQKQGTILLGIVFVLMLMLITVGLLKKPSKQIIVSTNVFNLGVLECSSRGGLISVVVDSESAYAKCNDKAQIPLRVTVTVP